MDIMPTLLDLAKTTYPQQYNGHELLPMQGISFLPVLQDKQCERHAILCNEHYGAKYIRYEGWKLVARNKEPWHLYHITEDETELNDLSGKYPERVRLLDSMWRSWANNNHVYPK